MRTAERAKLAASIVAGVGTAAAIRKARQPGNLAEIDAALEQERRCQARSSVIDALKARRQEVVK